MGTSFALVSYLNLCPTSTHSDHFASRLATTYSGSVAYPEYRYPAAIQDDVESLQWAVKKAKGEHNLYAAVTFQIAVDVHRRKIRCSQSGDLWTKGYGLVSCI